MAVLPFNFTALEASVWRQLDLREGLACCCWAEGWWWETTASQMTVLPLKLVQRLSHWKICLNLCLGIGNPQRCTVDRQPLRPWRTPSSVSSTTGRVRKG